MDFVLKTDKYHRILIKKTLVRKLIPKDQTIRHLLAYYQMIACEKYATEPLYNKYLGMAYDMRFNVSVQAIGKSSLYTYSISAVDPKYINDKDYTIDTIKDTFNECIKPVLNIEKNGFDKKLFKRAVEIYKSNLLDDEADDNKKSYRGAIKTMFSGTVRDYLPDGSLDDLSKITIAKLYKYYQSLLEDESCSYIVGDVSFDSNHKHTLTPKNDNCFKKRAIFEPIVYQDAPTQQCHLHIIYDTKIYRDNRLMYAVTLLNLGLGGTGNSMLFQIVREKYGLCYSISSSYLGASGIIIISAIISKNNIDKVLSAIDEVFEALLKEFNLEENKNYLIEQIISRKDNMSNLASDHLVDNFFTDSIPSYEEINTINSITSADIKTAFKKLKRRLVYVYGGSNDE